MLHYNILKKGGVLTFKKILIATDGSQSAKEAEKQAIEIAKKFGAQLTALYVVDLIFRSYKITTPVIKDDKMQSFDEYLEQVTIERSQELLMDLKEKAEKEGIQIETKVRKGNPWEEIVKEAKVGKYDLVVVGSNSRKGISRVLLGSVSKNVLTHAHCPVFVVRPLLGGIKRPSHPESTPSIQQIVSH